MNTVRAWVSINDDAYQTSMNERDIFEVQPIGWIESFRQAMPDGILIMAELTIAQYLAGGSRCLACGADFNPKCRLQYHLYFDIRQVVRSS